MAEPITKERVFEIYYETQPHLRRRSEWVMSRETAEDVAAAAGANWVGGSHLMGLPIRIDPTAEGIRLVPQDPSGRTRAIHSEKFHDALVEAGVIRNGEHIRRIVIDAKHGEAVAIHVERYGDERLLNVVRTLDTVDIQWVSVDGGEPRAAGDE